MDTGQFLKRLPPGLEPLADFAVDIRWAWSHAGDALWRRVDAETWDRTQNPWLILQNVTGKRLEELASDKQFKEELQRLVDGRKAYLAHANWFQRTHPDSPAKVIAYFSMEFGLCEALPLYTGGLGMLAGDHLKTASDLGIPVVGVGLLYQQGYFRQMLDAQGRQQEFYPYNDPASLSICPAIKPDGDWLRVWLDLPGRKTTLRVWQVRIGSVDLYLLDSNDPLNSPLDRGITGTLYGGGRQTRLLQEMVLGIGGWRLLTALGIRPQVLHLNEGHAAFTTLERVRSFKQRHGISFDEALWATRAGNVFTTHTPVAAGFDMFDTSLMSQYFRDYAETLGISLEHLLNLGRKSPGNQDEPFNMTYLALHTCGAVNAVSRLHKRVSQGIFRPLYPRWPTADVPVGHVTNGVHVPSWDSQHADELWTRACGKERWLGTVESIPKQIEKVSDRDLWEFQTKGRRQLVNYVRHRLTLQTRLQGAAQETIERAQNVLDPNMLTLGFARRFTAYKRPNLLLRNEERLIRLLTDQWRPVQLVVAGKAHPKDEEGKHMVWEMARFARRPEVRDRVVFLADYDIALAEQLVQGVDLWINTPCRPWEACGTSGMKVLVNGGLNLSELDGWWAEAYSPETGWALGDCQEHPEPEWDALEADELYRLLEEEVVPAFYDRDERNIPTGWVGRMRASMAALTPHFSSNRMLREYVEKYYLPAAVSYQRRIQNKAAPARALVRWQQLLKQHWPALRFLKKQTSPEQSGHRIQVHVYLDDLSPEMVKVEVYADPAEGNEPFRQSMERTGALPGSVQSHIYETTVPADRPLEHYTPRIVPANSEVRVPLEDTHILWSN